MFDKFEQPQSIGSGTNLLSDNNSDFQKSDLLASNNKVMTKFRIMDNSEENFRSNTKSKNKTPNAKQDIDIQKVLVKQSSQLMLQGHITS